MHRHTRSRVAVAVIALGIGLPVTWHLLKPPTTRSAGLRLSPAQQIPPGTTQARRPGHQAAAEEVGVAQVQLTPAMNIIGSRWQTATEPEFAAFAKWTTGYLATSVDERGKLLAEGVAAASTRRAALAKMIRANPEQALAAAVPVMVRRNLPAQITELLEERVSGSGSIQMLAATPPSGRTTFPTPYSRHALIGRNEYEAFTYGRRVGINSLPDVSIIGVALDGALAVSDSPLRALETGETAAGREVEEVCLISGITTPVEIEAPLNEEEITAVEVRGRVRVACEPSHVSKLEARLISGEGLLASGADGSGTVTGRPAFAQTHGPKKVLLIRVDFSDVPGTPVNAFSNTSQISEAFAVDIFNTSGGLKDFFEQVSYGKTSLTVAPAVSGDSPDVTPVLRMPSTASSYVTVGAEGVGNATLMHSDGRAAATAAGFNMANYERIGLIYSNLGDLPGSKMNFGGLGSTPGKEFWTNGSYEFSIIAHEVGHTYGLNHSSSLQVTDGNPVSSAGTVVEYGDLSDIMGDGKLISNHFSHWNKSIAQWMPDADVTTVNTGGTYRIYRFDHPNSNLADKLAMKVVRNRTQDYWIGYRRGTDSANYDNGAYVIFGANQNTNGLLLDLNTPGNSVADAPLGIGQTFNDTAAGITLHTVGQGGTGGPDEYLDVQVTFQPRIAWTQSTYTADEQSGTAALVLSRSNNSTGAISVHWATSPGSATSPADFTSSSGDVTWPSGDGADKIINIPLVADGSPEGIEDFTVTLTAPTGGSVIVDAPAATVSIVEPGANDSGFAANFINSAVSKLLVQPDGKILIAGPFTQQQDASFTIYNHVGIARMTASGALDTSFGTANGAGAGTKVDDMARQPDGKILVCGDFTTMNGVARNRIARLNADGSLDPSFDPGTGADNNVHAVLVQPDGKVLIGGNFLNFNGTTREYLARLNADGSLDTSFTGPDFADVGGWRVESLALQADGKLLVGGSFYFDLGGSFPTGICRVTTAGARDATFSGVAEGPTEDGNTNSIRSVEAIAVQLDGKILIAGGFTAYNNVTRGGLARLTATGALDTGFPATSDGACRTVLIQPDGKIVVGGTFTTFNGASASRLVRLNSAGVPDTVFGAAGGPDTSVNSLAMQADGKIVLGTNPGTFQTKTGSLFRIFGGLPALPGTIQLATATATSSEGPSAVLSVTRSGGSAGALSVNYATVIGTAGVADFTPAAIGTLSWADGDSVAKTITVPITTDALTEGAENFTVNLGQPLLGGAILGATQSTVVSISDPGSLTAYQIWRESKFTALELEDAGVSGNLSDPDSDGIVNLLEFAFNLLPKTANVSGYPTAAIQNISGSNYLTLSFRRQLAAPELTYTAQVNGALPGTWAGGAVFLNATGNGDGTEMATFRDSVPLNSTPRRFMRLQVTLGE